jgi:pilus assembly protein Flp/PilA
MMKLKTLFTNLRQDESGAAMVEYTILLGILAAAVVATVILVGTWISGRWTAFEALLP